MTLFKSAFRRKGRRRVAPSAGGSNALVNLLTLPVLGAPRGLFWLARKLAEAAEREIMDEGRIRGELMELQQQLEAGDVGEEEYDRIERVLLERLNTIREIKAA